MGELYYKVLGSDRRGGYSEFRYPPLGRWTKPANGDLVFCQNGYHVLTAEHLIEWLHVGPRIFTAEAEEVQEDTDKCVARRVRLLSETAWDDRRARLFAADCAERVLPIFEREHPEDGRPYEAIAVARRFAGGLATRDEVDAARDAAWDAAWAAGGDAGVAAGGAAAGDAVWAAGWAAARAAGGAAGWAAGVAAARDAAWAAGGDAAGAAAGDAAGAAGWDAARGWQTSRLMAYVRGELP